MRILYVAAMNNIHAVRWIEHFAGAGLDVHVVNVGLDQHQRVAGANYHDHLTRPSTAGGIVRQFWSAYRPFLRGMRRTLDAVKPHLVHVHGISVYAYIVKQCGFRPVVATAWGSDVLINPRESLKRRLIVRRSLAAADVITCSGEHIKQSMIKLGAVREAIEMVNFGTDVEQFSPAKRDPGLAQQLGFAPGTRLVLSTRMLRPIYDVATLIRAIPAVVRRRPLVGFVIVGDGSECARLKRLCTELGVQAHTRFVGCLSHADMPPYAASADVYVSTSLSDAGLAVSTAEAMASAVPPVVSDFGNNGDWIENGVTGYLFPLRDASALADRIVQLLEDPSGAQEIGVRARHLIETRSNWRQEMAKVMRLYERIALAVPR